MGFAQAVSSAFANYVNFSGRARRPEYWYFTLFLLIAASAAVLIEAEVLVFEDAGPVMGLVTLATIIPNIAVLVRRLHDIGRSGWWVLLAFIPLIGIIILIYWACLPGEPEPNAYGNPPA
jgi:uncharacterized membrane protein YhaH (DUF805 family)